MKSEEKPNCYDCVHVKVTEETFYEYGDESTADECGTNYNFECSICLRCGSKLCKEHYKKEKENNQ